MSEKFAKDLYESVVKENMVLYKRFFQYDPNEEGIIDYWKQAIALYDKLDEKSRAVLLSIVESTVIDTVSSVLAILDGSTGIEGINVRITLNDEENDGDLQDAFLAYVEDLKE